METINDQQRALMHKILDLVIDQNNKGNHSSYDYAGHVNTINLEILQGNYLSIGSKILFKNYFYITDKFDGYMTLEQIFNELSKL